MAVKFNAKEVFEIAESIEENGAHFYRTAAKMHPAQGALLNKFAEMEEEHKAAFASMRESIAGASGSGVMNDPNDEASLYLGSIAETHGGEGAPRMEQALTGKESVLDIIDMAIAAEKKSILFYVGLKDMVPESLGKRHVERIISEEKQHVTVLLGEKAKLA